MCVYGILPSTVNTARKHCVHTNPFDQRATAYIRVGYAYSLTGGSKGQLALGDAHPYLALFDLLKIYRNDQAPAARSALPGLEACQAADTAAQSRRTAWK